MAAFDDLDDFDRAILRELQRDARLTGDALGERVGLSATACQRRIRRLRETGAILSEVAVVAPAAAGRHLTALVKVVIERGRADIIDRFAREMRAAKAVQQCYYVTGECDFVLVVTARDMEDYERLTRALFFANPTIRKFETVVVMKTVKATLEVPFGD